MVLCVFGDWALHPKTVTGATRVSPVPKRCDNGSNRYRRNARVAGKPKSAENCLENDAIWTPLESHWVPSGSLFAVNLVTVFMSVFMYPTRCHFCRKWATRVSQSRCLDCTGMVKTHMRLFLNKSPPGGILAHFCLTLGSLLGAMGALLTSMSPIFM